MEWNKCLLQKSSQLQIEAIDTRIDDKTIAQYSYYDTRLQDNYCVNFKIKFLLIYKVKDFVSC